MSRYQEALGALAERGQPLGATRLAERVRTDLEVGGPPGSRRRRLFGPAAAAASFLLVLLLGAALVALRPWSAEPAGPEGVRFEQVPEGLQRPAPIPGGFFAVDGESGRAVVSTDLGEWRVAQLPETVFPGAIVSTADTWFLIEAGEESMWAMRGERRLAGIDIPQDLGGRLASMGADSGSLLAQIEDPFDELPATLWRLDGSMEWELLAPNGLPDDGVFEMAGREDSPGFVALAADGNGFTTWTSADGETWAEGVPVLVPGAADAAWFNAWVVSGGDRWIVVAVVYPEVEATGITVYTSEDGLAWAEQPAPPWTAEFPLVVEAGGWVVAAAGEEVWATRDGASWELVYRFPSPAWIEAASVVGGATVVLWSPVGGDPGVTTTTVTAPEVDPDPAGIALQEGILADGRVTREEFQSAVAAMVECMRERGLEVTEWQVDPDGSYGFSITGPERPGIDVYCQDSYLGRLVEAMGDR